MPKKIFLNIFFLLPDFLFRLIGQFSKIVIRGHALDDQTNIFLKFIPIKTLKDSNEESIKSIRKSFEKSSGLINIAAKPTSKVSFKDIDIGNGLIIRKYSPSILKSTKSILYFHGGGYIFGSINTHHNIVMYYASFLGVEIYSLNYSLSPENKFPIALDDACKAYNWMLDKNINSNEISLCGDSAGAHLAASLTNKLLKDSKDLPGSQLLIYPMVSPSCDFKSFDDFGNGFYLTASNMKWMWKKFKNKNDDFENPCFDLLKTDINSNNFPKTLIVTAGFDVLCDEAEKYAYLLHQKSINIRQLHYPSLIHGFASMSRLRKAKLAVDHFLDEYEKIL